MFSILKGATRCNCRHDCDREADGFLLAPDGKVNPGGFMRRECIAPTIREYREKLGERWRFDPGVEHHDEATGNVSIRPTAQA